MQISVIIPTFKRVKDLEKCLDALKIQSRAADEILTVIRGDDLETLKFIASENIAKEAAVEYPGQVEALNAGLKAAKGDIICCNGACQHSF